MKKAILISGIVILTVSQVNAAKRHTADPSATKIEWTGKKVVGSSHNGTINLKEGWITTSGDAITGGEFIVDMSTIKNLDLKDDKMRARLEGHLNSDDFFGVEKYPVSKLVLTGSSRFTGGKATVRGNLTIKAATHPVEFAVVKSAAGGVTTYTASIVFDRSLYDVRFGSGKFFSNLGDNVIVDDISLVVTLVVR